MVMVLFISLVRGWKRLPLLGVHLGCVDKANYPAVHLQSINPFLTNFSSHLQQMFNANKMINFSYQTI